MDDYNKLEEVIKNLPEEDLAKVSDVVNESLSSLCPKTSVEDLLESISANRLNKNLLQFLSRVVSDKKKSFEKVRENNIEEAKRKEYIKNVLSSKKFVNFLFEVKSISDLIESLPTKFSNSLNISLNLKLKLSHNFNMLDFLLEGNKYEYILDLFNIDKLNVTLNNREDFTSKQVELIEERLKGIFGVVGNLCDDSLSLFPELYEKVKELPEKLQELLDLYDSFDITEEVLEEELSKLNEA